MIGGFIPAKAASKKDPVIALRTEWVLLGKSTFRDGGKKDLHVGYKLKIKILAKKVRIFCFLWID